MPYEKFDLNLFSLFDIMMKRRSVSAAARELGVTASAVSHGLSRLRKLLGDDLFISGPAGMQPTLRALELAPDVQDGLSKLAQALEQRPFIPAEAVRTFVIGATDYATTVILPHAIRQITATAPYVHIKVFPPGRIDVVQQLKQDRLHVVMGWFDTLPEDIDRQTLFMEQESIVVRSGHPLANSKPTYGQLLDFPHVVVDLTGSEGKGKDGFIDDHGVVRRTWIERLLIEADNKTQGPVGHVAITVPHFLDVPPLLEGTDLVATLPRRLALRIAQQSDLVILDLPYHPLTVPFEMVWHKRAATDAGLRWLLSVIRCAADGI